MRVAEQRGGGWDKGGGNKKGEICYELFSIRVEKMLIRIIRYEKSSGYFRMEWSGLKSEIIFHESPHLVINKPA